MPKYFVWLKGLRGPEPQLWNGDQTTGSGRFKRGEVGTGDLLFFKELTAEQHDLSLNELAELFKESVSNAST